MVALQRNSVEIKAACPSMPWPEWSRMIEKLDSEIL
jgi:hypothetical protein